MAIARVDVESGPTPAVATSASWARTVGAGLSNSFLIVPIGIANGGGAVTTTSVVYDSGGTNQAMTLLGRYQEPSGTLVTIELWGRAAPTAGTGLTILATFSANTIFAAGSALYTGVNQASPWNAASPQTSTGANPANPSLAITSASGEYGIDVLGVDLGSLTTMTPGGSQTQIVQRAGVFGSYSFGASDQASAGATVTNTWTGTNASNVWFQVGGSLKPAGGGGGGRTLFFRSGLDGLSTSGPKQFNPSLGYHRTPEISLEAYRREQARKHREFMATVARRSA